ncbi:PAS domain S-box protein [Candidatus Dependentiae bacterium]|nr:PAS domain S-box protein [Candidatus Dependentiae bacterium]
MAAVFYNNKTFFSTLDNLPDMIWLADKNNKFYFFNKAFLDFTGNTLENQIKNGLNSNIHHEDKEYFAENLILNFNQKKQFKINFRFLKNNGEFRFIENNVSPMCNEKNEIEYFLGIISDITKKNEIFPVCENHDKFLQGIIDSLTSNIAVIDKTGTIITTNKSWNTFFKSDKDPADSQIWIGINYLEVLKKAADNNVEYSNEAYLGLKQVLEGSLPHFTMEYKFTPKKKERWYILNATPLKCETGGVVIGHIDITERKTNEHNIKSQNDFLRSILDSFTNPFYVVDAKTYTITMMNSAAQKKLHKKYSDKTNLKCYNVSHKSDKPCEMSELLCPVREINKTKKPVLVEHSHFDHSDHIRHTEIRAYPIFDEQGEVSQVIEYIIDITDRKNEDILKLKLFTAIQQTPSVIVITDLKGNIEFVNKAFEKNTGYSAEEVKGKSTRVLKTDFHPAEVYVELWGTISSGKIWHGELFNKRKDGSTYWEYAAISPIINEKGEIISYIAVKDDITERKKIEQELKEAKKSAEIANQSKSIFLANMSHEIRTPLNAILGFTDILLAEESNKQKKQHLQIISDSGKNLLALINDILDFSKIEAGKIIIEKTNFSIFKLFSHIHGMFIFKAKEKNIIFETEIPSDFPDLIYGDEYRFNQIILNLTSNAFKFTEKGKILIKADYDKTNSIISISVSDTGIGIPEKKISKLFNPFEQLDSSTTRKYGGTGLGLAITKKLTELMDGKIFIESKENAGSLFKVEIPCPTKDSSVSLTEKSNIKSADYDKEFIKPIKISGDNMVKSWLSKMEGNTKLEKLVIMGIRSLPEKIERLNNSINSKNNQDIKFISHDIKGFSGNLGMTEIYELSRQIDNEIRKENCNYNFIKSKFDELNEVVKNIPPDYFNAADGSQNQIQKEKKYEKFQILLAEDNPANQILLQTFLEKLGLFCDIADNGKIAVEMLSKKKYNLLLLDIQMPVMDGEAALKIIRSDSRYKNLHIIALTANAMKGDSEKFLKAGCNDYIPKPIDRNLFNKKITKLIQK